MHTTNKTRTQIYYAGCICLLLVTVALRFYNLTGQSLGDDEALIANGLRGSFQAVFENTRNDNSSPILYPLVLYAVQKVESSLFTVRLVPAVASVLTVAALLLLLPRVGISRWAAFIAALLAASSAEAILQAQLVKEYSVDAFVAALMLVGALSYIQGDGGHSRGMYVLFCVSLFVAPLVQYGLVLFGIAIFGTIAVIEGKNLWTRRGSLEDGLRFPTGWVWNKLKCLIWPAASFGVGSVISYAITFRYQLELGVFIGEGRLPFLDVGYYSGEYSDVPAMIWFVLSHTAAVLRYHLTEVITVLGIVVFGAFLIVSLRKARLDAVMTLLLLSLAIVACTGLIEVYPYEGTRRSLFLAPIIFLAFGHALHSIALNASSLTRRAWAAHAGMALAAGIIVITGVAAIRDSALYQEKRDIEFILMTLEELSREDDVVYVAAQLTHELEFYQKGRRDNYCYGSWPEATFASCTERLFRKQPDAERMWLITRGKPYPLIEAIAARQDAVEQVGHRMSYNISLHLWTDPFFGEPSQDELDAIQYASNNAAAAQSAFDLYTREGTVIYVKEPCGRSDAADRFFLHVTPTDVEDLPDDRKQYGFDNLDFYFFSFGIVTDGKCVAIRDLPDYDIESISTGQIIIENGPTYRHIWKSEFHLDE